MPSDDQAAAAVPSLVDSLQAYIDDLPQDQQADALHQVDYGFYTRIAIIDRTTYELAAWAKDEAGTLTNVADSLTEALRDNALFFVLCERPHRTNCADVVTMPTYRRPAPCGAGVGGARCSDRGGRVGIVSLRGLGAERGLCSRTCYEPVTAA